MWLRLFNAAQYSQNQRGEIAKFHSCQTEFKPPCWHEENKSRRCNPKLFTNFGEKTDEHKKWFSFVRKTNAIKIWNHPLKKWILTAWELYATSTFSNSQVPALTNSRSVTLQRFGLGYFKSFTCQLAKHIQVILVRRCTWYNWRRTQDERQTFTKHSSHILSQPYSTH